MAQRYRPGPAHERMAEGLCPECGREPGEHGTSGDFWEPQFASCSLRADGVRDRVEQFREDHGFLAIDPPDS